MKEIQEVVTNRPEIFQRPTNCPKCSSDKIRDLGTSGTLLGFSGPSDPNHYTTFFKCGECKSDFTYDVKSGNTWMTMGGDFVVRGLPSCFENYIYDCECGGKIHREYRDIDDAKKVKCLSYNIVDGKSIRKFRTFFKCDGPCGKREETAVDYWYGR